MPKPLPQSWPLTRAAVLRHLSVSRLVKLAGHFRVPLPRDPTWEAASERLLAAPAAHPVAILHQLTRRELGGLCMLVGIGDDGPTQTVLAQLLPLCEPSGHNRKRR